MSKHSMKAVAIKKDFSFHDVTCQQFGLMSKTEL